MCVYICRENFTYIDFNTYVCICIEKISGIYVYTQEKSPCYRYRFVWKTGKQQIHSRGKTLKYWGENLHVYTYMEPFEPLNWKYACDILFHYYYYCMRPYPFFTVMERLLHTKHRDSSFNINNNYYLILHTHDTYL